MDRTTRRTLRLFGVAMIAAMVWTGMASADPAAGDAALFDRLDADKNGQISSHEVSQEHQRLFGRLLRRGDIDGDAALSREEFLTALVPSRPEKPMEAKQPSTLPQADAVRWLLLTLDTNGNSRIESKEVPADMQPIFEALVERLDANKNGVLEQYELSRGGPPLARIAGRYVQREGIDVDSELKKLEKKLGPAANRFEQPPVSMENLGNPRQARQLFARLDGNGNGQLERNEIKAVPEPIRRPLERLLRRADRDEDGRLSEREFLAAAKRLAQQRRRREAMESPAAEKAKPAPKSSPAE